MKVRPHSRPLLVASIALITSMLFQSKGVLAQIGPVSSTKQQSAEASASAQQTSRILRDKDLLCPPFNSSGARSAVRTTGHNKVILSW